MTKDEYRSANIDCEYCPYIGSPESRETFHPRGQGLELDHIWGRKGPCDVVSNWAMACPHCHDTKTVKFQKYARLAITYHKMKKGELDLDELKACSGYNVIGWVDNLIVSLSLTGRWLKLANEIMRRHCDGEH